MPLLPSIAAVGVMLIAFGVIYKARSDDKERYATRARVTGVDPEQLDEVYRVYRDNRAFVGNIAIWFGGGFMIAAAFRLV